MLPAVLFPIPTLTVTAVIDILAVAFVIYQLLQIVRGTRAAHILVGILAVVVTYEIALRTGLEALRSLLASLAPYTAIAIIVLFQSEIRRTLARLGRKRLFGGYRSPESTAEILLALGSLSRDRTGALIVLERDIALHDGAIIVQKDRICAAACFLPLSVNPAFSTKTGTRHRAGIGITEETDCLSLIVSEESGLISVATFGDIETGLTIEQVDDRIQRHFGVQRKVTPPSRPSPPSRDSASREDTAVESARRS
jgi:diadenylate cyclase